MQVTAREAQHAVVGEAKEATLWQFISFTLTGRKHNAVFIYSIHTDGKEA